jgi:hypothetical protein
MTRSAGATWAGMSAYDFANERIFFRRADPNPSSGLREFAIGENGVTYTGRRGNEGTYTLVSKIDFVNDKLSLWINPDLTQPEGPPNATRIYLGDNWNSAIRLGSGGSGATTWDDVAVGTSWQALQQAYPHQHCRGAVIRSSPSKTSIIPMVTSSVMTAVPAGTSTMTTPAAASSATRSSYQTGTMSKAWPYMFLQSPRDLGIELEARVSSHRIRWQLQQCRHLAVQDNLLSLRDAAQRHQRRVERPEPL